MKHFLLLLLCIISITNIFSSENNNSNKQIIDGYKFTSSFCGFRGDHFHTGIDLAARGKEINTLIDSEVIFYSTKRKRSINYGNGNFVILENSNKKLRMNYSHIKDDSFDSEKLYYKAGEKLATVGNSGHSTGEHLHFEIEDTENNKLINPLHFINVTDTIQPVINDIFFIDQNGKKVSLYVQGANKLNRGGDLFIKCYDKIDNSNYPISPYKIKVIINGIEHANLTFDSLKKKGHQFYLENKKKFDDIYLNKTEYEYYVLNYSGLPGVIGIKIQIEDFSGNKTVFTRAITITKPKNEKRK